ncbi:MAG TPA: SiaB family protein kinase [Bacteroidales bacterium]|nr:SiaB family protein kinase [Bacteroidales bacterium]
MGFNIESYLPDQSNNNVILFYKGNVDSDVINQILDKVEDKMIKVNDQSKLRKKVYNVLVETLQNLYHHVDKVPEDFEDQMSDKFGILLVTKTDNGYKITTGNFVKSINVDKLEEKINKINKSSHEEIKELYKFILNHQRISAKGGGGLGLVDIARKTGNKLQYSFKEYDDLYSFFFLDVLVDKDN